jgi:hypothetical protein
MGGSLAIGPPARRSFEDRVANPAPRRAHPSDVGVLRLPALHPAASAPDVRTRTAAALPHVAGARLYIFLQSTDVKRRHRHSALPTAP